MDPDPAFIFLPGGEKFREKTEKKENGRKFEFTNLLTKSVKLTLF